MDTENAPHFGAALLLSTAILAASPVARAQAPSPEDMASARVLGTEGVRLADSGDCTAAIPKLEAAEKLYHAPSTLERLGECQISAGRLVAGTESLNRVVREPLPPNAPQAFVVARQRAQQALSAALPRVGKLRIHVDGAPPDQVSVTVDGVKVPSALFDADRPTDPGVHEVKATAPGYTTVSTTVTLQDGTGAPVSLKIEPEPSAPQPPAASPIGMSPAAPTAETAALRASSSGSPTSASSNRGFAIAAFAVGGVGVAVGSVFGILALDTKSTLDSQCSNKVCPQSSQSDIDSLGSRATIANVGFGVGLVGLAVGVVLLATSHGVEAHAAAAPWIGVGAAGLRGRFE